MKAPIWPAALLLAAAVMRGDDGNSGKEKSELRPLNVKTVVQSLYEVGNRNPDPQQRRDYRSSQNLPQTLTEKQAIGEPGKLSLVVETEERMVDQGFEGFRLRIVNRSAARVTLPAIDSCLYLVQEARNEKGEWLALQRTTPATGPRDCAVGSHRVFLEPGEYWNVAAPRFEGTFRTKLRFRLNTTRDRGSFVYSGEFDGSVNQEQLAGRAR
jgi:hypothetical protein